MSRFRICLACALPPEEAWRRVLDLRAHGAVLPLTTVLGERLAADDLRAGDRFVARTAIGPLRLDDAMLVEAIVPPGQGRPGHARIRKQGRAVRGWIELRVAASAYGSTVDWRQEITVWGVPRLAGPVTAAVARLAYRAALRRLLARDGPAPMAP